MSQFFFLIYRDLLKIAEEMNPEVLIDELDKFFFHFDSVVEKYGIEKIKDHWRCLYVCRGYS
ncbi:MAG: adenylate/guanylate cyclase domain-containing protein [Marinilabiliales bacterium]|nr:adenylate/guanylate cyclase domain-containing protein [Marinilabiliales bacterium]